MGRNTLLEVVREAGLSGRVQVGMAIEGAPTRKSSKPEPARDPLWELDSLLGLWARPARGQLIEITGARSSGRTALAYRLAAGTSERGELVGWVDLPDALDPRFLRRSGIESRSLLWVRPPGVRAALRATELMLKTGFATVAVDLEGASPRALSRLGPSIWTRLLQTVRQTRATVVLLNPPGQSPVAGASATLGIYTDRRRATFEWGLFEGLDYRASIVRNRAGPSGAELPLRVDHRPAGPTAPG